MTRALVVMGVTGCGKSTLGRALARALGWQFVEGDSLHPPENMEKMKSGYPLNDDDRAPFLRNVAAAIAARSDTGVVASCSALKRRYRDWIRQEAGNVRFVLPLIDRDALIERLALNLASRGLRVCVYNRTRARTRDFVDGRGSGRHLKGAETLTELVASLAKPRRIFMMVKAGGPVDALIAELTPLLDAGDILIDGGNSRYSDTTRRVQQAESQGLLYVGSGVSGGEEGALRGPSLMPGGSAAAWPHIRAMFEAIAARTPDGEPCCAWIGASGAGHFVKMIHNGIEYGDMQIICETYDLMKRGLGMSNDAMASTFADWNQGELASYLIEITRDILGYRNADGEAVIDLILDTAGQKGTGRWAVAAALEEGVPLTLIGEAVLARFLSAAKAERNAAAELLDSKTYEFEGARDVILDDLRAALYAAKIVSYAQGYQLMRAASQSHEWGLDFGGIALTWRGGCIIRSAFLDDIRAAFARDPDLSNLLLDVFFRNTVEQRVPALRRVVAAAVSVGLPVPCLSAALTYWDGLRAERLPANLLQAQRDYFGAHLFERVDRPRGERFHVDWTGKGGTTTST
ncbi:MAG: decarboxylating NADP(+)-dependent phosphogluconate dehydrogenase [Gammaproteobacteria bacterium]